MPVYCKKCGAVVMGKFCSCCGTKLRTDMDDFKLELNRKKRAFVNQRYEHSISLVKTRAATFAWDNCAAALTRNLFRGYCGELPQGTLLCVSQIEEMADALYESIIESYLGLGLPV